MIDLASTTQVLLRDAGFVVRLATIRQETLICFEDELIIGFCVALLKPGDVINKWRSYEDEILTRFAPSLRGAGEKAWNVYCVFLTGSEASEEERRQVSWLEEDLARTRKIAACGVTNREELVRALLPVLPIQYQPLLRDEDATERLKRRLADIAPAAATVALDEAVPALEVARLLGGRS